MSAPAPPSRKCTVAGTRKLARLALLACIGAAAVPAQAVAGGEALLAAAAGATCTAVGRIEAREQLDAHGFAAWLTVERVLAGDCGAAPRLRLGWEELARGRAPRFADGDRVVAALEPIPGHTLWRSRFAADLARGPVYTPAARGDAWERDPDAATVDLLGAFVAAGADDARRIALAHLARTAPSGLALAAVARLDADGGGAAPLPAEAATALAACLADAGRPPEVRRRVLAAAGRARWANLRDAVAAAGAAGSDVAAPAIAALADIDGMLPDERVATLLASTDAGLRAVGARYAQSEAALDALAPLALADPAAEVRAAAAATLVRHRGVAAFAAIRPAFGDAAPEVPVALAAAIAPLGASAVAPLEELFLGGSFAEARGAALALHGLGAPGRECLARLAREAGDERRRHLAEIAVGRLETHTH